MENSILYAKKQLKAGLISVATYQFLLMNLAKEGYSYASYKA